MVSKYLGLSRISKVITMRSKGVQTFRVITVRGKSYQLPGTIMVRTNGVRISRVIPNI